MNKENVARTCWWKQIAMLSQTKSKNCWRAKQFFENLLQQKCQNVFANTWLTVAKIIQIISI